MSYRDDSKWQAAQQVYVNPPGSTADQRLMESLAAARKMFEIERNTTMNADEAREGVAKALEAHGVTDEMLAPYGHTLDEITDKVIEAQGIITEAVRKAREGGTP